MKIVIRAGGHGTRLWPLSRKHKPKQFHAILGEKTMLRTTFERVLPLVEQASDIFISCNQEYIEALAEYIPEVPSTNYIVEPEARNTGAAIALETAYLVASGVSGDEMVATIPSDDHITKPEAFREMVEDIETFLEDHGEYVVAPAVVPGIPSDGYSYLRPGKQIDSVHDYAFTLVGEWVEKPSQVQSREMVRSGNYYAHVGMYFWKLDTAARMFSTHQAEGFAAAQAVVNAMHNQDTHAVQESYSVIAKESIEHYLIEHVTEVAMVVDEEMGWSDVGKWQIVKHLLENDSSGNVHQGKVVSHESGGNLVIGPEDKMIAVLGMDDVIVVDTDDALLVCPADKSGELKALLSHVAEVEDGRHL